MQILETKVYFGPELVLHRGRDEVLPSALARKLLARLFPAGQSGCIPTAAITGTNGKTTSCRMVARILMTAGYTTGLACTDGVYMDGKPRREGIHSGVAGALTVFRDPTVDAAVLETSRGTLIERGLAFDACQVSACTNVAADHLGVDGIETLDEMAVLKRLVVERAEEMAVLNADDPRCLNMAPHVRARRLCLVSTNPKNPAVAQHLNRGGSAVVLGPDEDWLTLCERAARTPLLRADEIPATWNGKAAFNIENALIAIAVARGMGVDIESIRAGLRSFGTTYAETPGRLNLCDAHGFTVIFDFAHNGHGMAAVCALTDKMPVSGRRIILFSAVANYREEDILSNAEAVAGHFDHYLCYNFENLRGQDPHKVPDLLKRGLRDQGVPNDAISTIYADEAAAIDTALNMAESGDLLALLVDSDERYWEQVTGFKPASR